MRTITSRVDSTVIQTTIKTLQSLVFLRLHLKVGKEGNQSCRNDCYRQRWWQWDYRLWIITKFVLLNMPDVPYCYLTSLIKKSGQCPSFPLNFSYPCADGRKWWAALNLESRCSHNLRKKEVFRTLGLSLCLWLKQETVTVRLDMILLNSLNLYSENWITAWNVFWWYSFKGLKGFLVIFNLCASQLFGSWTSLWIRYNLWTLGKLWLLPK